MLMKHEILEEVWRVRDKISAECGYDLKKLVARIRRLEVKHSDRLVSYAPRKPKGVTRRPSAKAAKLVRHKSVAAHA
jgi:hypothetical protein